MGINGHPCVHVCSLLCRETAWLILDIILFSYHKLNVEGPLKVYPSAENDERTEACGILCLGGEPTVLVLATRSGRIDHCIVLDSDNNQDHEEVSNDHYTVIKWYKLGQSAVGVLFIMLTCRINKC